MAIRIKICGITTFQDAKAAVSFGAHALGFILVRKSPRYVDPDRVRDIVRQLPPFVQSVGVFVNEDPGRVGELISHCGLDLVQFHGEESPSCCKRFETRAVKAFRVKGIDILDEIRAYEGSVRAVLLDSWSSGAHGGTGKSFDWSIARRVVEALTVPVILAGGLDVSTVSKAISLARPFGVDVSSGVEKAPGIKDRELVKEFIKKVNQAAKGFINQKYLAE